MNWNEVMVWGIAGVVLASVLRGIFGDVGGGLDKQQLGLSSPHSSTSGESAAPTPGPGAGSSASFR